MRNWVMASVGLVASAALANGQDKAAKAGQDLAKAPEQASAPAERRALRVGDYGQWERLGGSQLSNDGKWMATSISRVDETRELQLRMLATNSVEVFEEGQGGVFSEDSNWFLYEVGVGPKERKAARKSGEPVRTKTHLRSLVDGEETVFEGVALARFREDSAYLLLRRDAPKGRKGSGADLVVRDLKTGSQTTFGNVSIWGWNDDDSLLAMIVDTEDDLGNGLQVFDTRAGTLRTLDSCDRDYAGLIWREDSSDLAVMREHEHEDDEDATHSVLAFRGLDGKKVQRDEFDPSDREGFPDMRVVSFGGLRWTEKGDGLFFGIKEWENRPAADEEEADEKKDAKKGAKKGAKKKGSDDEAGDEEKGAGDEAGEGDESADAGASEGLRGNTDEPSNVEVWHAKDIDIQPLQKRRLGALERENFSCAWWLDDDAFVQLGNETTESVMVLDGDRVAVGSDHTPYERLRMFGPTLNDRYLIDTRSGKATRFLEANKYLLGGSPGGRHVVYVKDDQIWSYDARSGTHTDLTGGLGSDFINHTMSNLTDEKPAYGVAGYSTDGDVIYLYDRYDLWRVDLSGKGGQRLTRGAEEQIVHRRQILNEEEPGEIEDGADLLLTVYGDRTKKSGFARLEGGKKLRTLRYEALSLGRMSKAEDAEVYAWIEQDFDDSPDVFTAGADLAEPRQVTATNPQQKDYLWGHSELFDYTNDRGEDLQASLHYPAGYEAGKQYPMIVYIYELRSQSVHSYSVPTELHPYNPAVFTAQGYFVYQPDITYRPQNPGLSAKECVVPAVKKVLETGMVDPDRVGLIGHSWGGYQTAFLSTVTDIFAACVAGAPLTNMMSMSMSIYWNSGQTDAWIFHESQGRMDRPFWQDVDTYRNNSAIFNLDTMTTPLLMAFGDEDGAVDWHQGIEFYNAARLAQKDFVLLVYPGENHSNSQEENQVDYHHRVLEWFDHYLKGGDAKKWILEGKSHRDRQKELEERKKEKKGR